MSGDMIYVKKKKENSIKTTCYKAVYILRAKDTLAVLSMEKRRLKAFFPLQTLPKKIKKINSYLYGKK